MRLHGEMKLRGKGWTSKVRRHSSINPSDQAWLGATRRAWTGTTGTGGPEANHSLGCLPQTCPT